MKKNCIYQSLKVLFLTVLLLGVSVIAHAQMKQLEVKGIREKTANSRSFITYDEKKFLLMEGRNNMLVPKTITLMHQQGEQNATVNFMWEVKGEADQPALVIIVDANESTPKPIRKSITYGSSSLPTGTYDMIATTEINDATAIIIKEGVEIKNDTTINFNIEDAKNEIRPEFYKRNGEICKPCLYEVDNNYNYVVLDPGDDFFGVWDLFRKDVGQICGCTTSADYPDCSDLTVFVNDVSDNYQISFLGRVIQDNEKDQAFILHTDGMREQVVKNNPEDFILYEEKFSLTPAFGESEYGSSPQYILENVFQGMASNGLVQTWIGSTLDRVSLYVCLPPNEESSDFNTLIIPQYSENGRLVVNEWIDYDENGEEIVLENSEIVYDYQTGTPAYLDKTGINYCVSYPYNYYPYCFNEEGKPNCWYPGKEAFSFTNKEKAQPFGGNCPILVMTINNGIQPHMDQKSSNIGWFDIGRYGELRPSAPENYSVNIMLDGETIINDIYQLWFLQTMTTGIEKGVIDVEFTTNNIYVDGLQGKNSVYLSYDAAKEDWTPPTLSMLQFRSTDNMVTDRFETAEQGIISFSGADMTYHSNYPNPSYGWNYYSYDVMTTNVSYSPFNKNEWTQLEGIEEVPENYQEPFFGYFYRGSLKDVTGQAEKGWFDLKIRLEDKAGNWQEQVISPAFRIDDLVDTGISQLTIDNGQLTIPGNETVYDVMGRRVADKSSKAMKGIQIVRRQNGDVRKVVVR